MITHEVEQMKYWRGEDERAQTAAYRDALENEFGEPVEVLAPTRRGFMGLLSATFAAGGLAGCVRRPEERILPYSKAPEDTLPGVALHYATATHVAGHVIGLLVESHEGRPTKIEGNPSHPASLGAASAIHQAMILDLYAPDRLQAPLHLKKTVGWAEVDAFFEARFKAAEAQRGEGVFVLAPALPSPTIIDTRKRLKRRLPALSWITYEPISEDNERAGLTAAYGQPLRPQLRLDIPDVILCLDADPLGLEGDAIEQSHRWAKKRRFLSALDPKDRNDVVRPELMGRLYVAEGRYSLTGSVADHRLRLRPDRVEAFTWALTALALERGAAIPERMQEEAKRRGVEGLSEPERAFAVQVIADIYDRSNAFGFSRVPLIVAGRRQPPIVHHLVAALNRTIGASGLSVFYFRDQRRDKQTLGDAEGLKALAQALNAGEVKTLVILGGDPVRTAPPALGLAEALKRAEVIVQLTDRLNETSPLAEWRLPEAHFLESWCDWSHINGVVAVQQPLIAPLYGGLNALEVVARMAGGETRAHALVRAYWRGQQGARGFHRRWRAWLHEGVIERRYHGAFPTYRRVNDLGPRDAIPTPAPREGLLLELIEDAHLFDGRFAQNPWLQEAPDPMTKITWDNAALLSPKTASALGITAEQMIRLSAGERFVDVVAWVQPGMADEQITLALGYGQRLKHPLAYGAQDRPGFDAYPLRAADGGDLRYGVTVAPRPERYPLACVQRYSKLDPGHGYAPRPNVREGTLAEWRADPSFARAHVFAHGQTPSADAPVTHLPERSLFGDHDYSQGHQWGMVIDLNTCTGCNACLIACMSENNIPAVGKDQVARGREMHWIRMDRYFVGDEVEPRVLHQPMACHHCETAPCENVCPVAATTHSPEGLNDMAYNRCIGTRYCSNNCPFKVRRFNFYNYTKDQPETVQMQRNPNVTVRFRGVIEKCTYCVQRINAGKRLAKGAKPAEIAALIESITPACAQTCPTGSIIFGDINDPQSAVAKVKRQRRDYTALSSLNLQPRTSYLARIRNPRPAPKG
ncbi:TAT-variant-translocated molybdopterin oxidoreductase [Myxococcota bacterium]|nr:TAT-variant-translocated molybdopterin oxidoreductase [Myxococcota bacterium]